MVLGKSMHLGYGQLCSWEYKNPARSTGTQIDVENTE
jgi:hypothetical protein